MLISFSLPPTLLSLSTKMLPYGDMVHSRIYAGENKRFGSRWSKFKSPDLMLISYISLSNWFCVIVSFSRKLKYHLFYITFQNYWEIQVKGHMKCFEKSFTDFGCYCLLNSVQSWGGGVYRQGPLYSANPPDILSDIDLGDNLTWHSSVPWVGIYKNSYHALMEDLLCLGSSYLSSLQ